LRSIEIKNSPPAPVVEGALPIPGGEKARAVISCE